MCAKPGKLHSRSIKNDNFSHFGEFAMNYLVSDVDTASVPAGGMHEFRAAHSDQPASSILNTQVFTRFM